MVDEVRPAGSGVQEDAGEPGAEQRIDDREHGNDRQAPADRPARRLQQHHDHDRAHHHIGGAGVADAVGEIVEHPRHIERGCHGGDAEQPVEQRDAARCQPSRGPHIASPRGHEREHQEDQPDHERQVDAAVRRLLEQPEAGRVVVEAGQCQQQAADQQARRARQLAETDFGIELLFEAAGIGVGNDLDGHKYPSSPVVVPLPARPTSQGSMPRSPKKDRPRLHDASADDGSSTGVPLSHS